MKKFKVYDLYDGEMAETLGYADNLKEVKKLAKERYKDTDGECFVIYAELVPEINKYDCLNYKVVTF